MNNDYMLDNRIKAAMTYYEDKLAIDYEPLEKAKQRLKEDTLFDGRIDMKSLFNKKKMKVSFVFILVFLLLGGVLGVSASVILKTDNIDYPFVDDQQILGKWQSVDFVSSANEFAPGETKWQGDLYLKEFAFASGGKMLMSVNSGNRALAGISSTWTKGLILNPQEKTASKYEIADIDGSSYMFLEWKSGDYTIRGMEPRIYVLKKMDSNDYSSYSCEKRVDKIDYPFIDDPQVLGKWDAVDFVRTMDLFDPEKKNWISDLYLTGLTFDLDGRMTFTTTKGSLPEFMTWTKGLVLCKSDQTASAYTIKEIKGSTYMFFEWKSGDYTMRGMDPQYYVLKKN